MSDLAETISFHEKKAQEKELENQRLNRQLEEKQARIVELEKDIHNCRNDVMTAEGLLHLTVVILKEAATAHPGDLWVVRAEKAIKLADGSSEK